MATAMASAITETDSSYAPIPLRGLAGEQALSFPLYLRTGDHRFVLYQPGGELFNSTHESRLILEGVKSLFIDEADRTAYSLRIEPHLDLILKDRSLPVEDRAQILGGVSLQMAQALFAQQPGVEEVKRARQVMTATANMIVRDRAGFAAIRKVLEASEDLVLHSLAVGMLSIGLAQEVMGSDPSRLLCAGMAGLLHDVGRIGHEDEDLDDQTQLGLHAQRGHQLLSSMKLSKEICEASLHHHERIDGSGFPQGLQGKQLPAVSRIVGLVDAFHEIYGHSGGEVPVFHCLRSLAQTYRGGIDPEIAGSFVKVFSR